MNKRSTFLGDFNKRFVKHYNKYSESLLSKNELVHFMNLGYQGKEVYHIKDSDQKFALPINLYLKVLDSLETKPLSALEVGSGLGGGCYLLKNYLKIDEVIGVDYAKKNVEYSNFKFNKDGIYFQQYSSDNFPAINKSFDLVLSLEASQHFDNWGLFIENAYKVLNNGGVLIYADLFHQDDIPIIQSIIEASPFEIMIQEDITEGVSTSISFMEPPKKNFLYKIWCALNGMNDLIQFEAYNNSIYHQKFQNGTIKYFKFHLKKNG